MDREYDTLIFVLLGIPVIALGVIMIISYASESTECPIDSPSDLMDVYSEASAQHPEGLTECELIAQDYFESAFDPDAKSPAGAAGIAQFEPQTAQELGIDPLDPVASIHAQAAYMSRLMHVWHRHKERSERVSLALASYNWGIGNMLKSQSLHKWNTWHEAFDFMPAETQSYVSKIMRNSK